MIKGLYITVTCLLLRVKTQVAHIVNKTDTDNKSVHLVTQNDVTIGNSTQCL